MKRPALWFAVLVHLVLSSGYAVRTPAFEPPDEADHFRAASFLAHVGRMPYVPGTAAELGGTPGLDEEQVAHHPPLYYGMLAGWMLARGRGDTTFSVEKNPDFNVPGRPSRHLQWRHGFDETRPGGWWLLWELRLFSVVCGLITLLSTHRLGRLVFPGREAIADIAVVCMACLPMFSFACGALDNGNLAMALCHLAFCAMAACLLKDSVTVRDGVVLGILCGLALMAKLTAMVLLPLLAVVYGRALLRHRSAPGATLRSGLVAAAILLGIAGWFFVRNRVLYGDLLAQRVHAAAFRQVVIPDEMVVGYLTGDFLPALAGSLLGNLGSMILPMPTWLAWSATAVAILAGGGLVESLIRQDRRPRMLLVGFLGLACAGVFAIVLRFNMTYAQPQGRYLFTGLGPFLLLFALGLHTLVGRRLRWPAPLRVGMASVPAVVAGIIFAGYYLPAFAPSLAQAGRYHASLVDGVTTPPATAGISLTGPANGAALSSPPRFAWRPVHPEAPHAIHIYDGDGRIWMATHAWFHLLLKGDGFAMPEPGWQLLPVDVELFWMVRELPDRSLGQTDAEMPGSAPSRFTRVR